MSFEKIKNRLGFGCMRMPTVDKEVDLAAFCRMVDLFMEAGFNYFDTARGYLGEKSEGAVREAVVKRYPRESFVLTNKLSTPYFHSQEEIRPYFESQLKECGVEYFDFYLMHAQEKKLYDKYRACKAYETALELKAEGKIRHFGISFHDSAALLEQILTDYPQIEVVQLQFNYADLEDSSVQSAACYEVCRKYGKPVIVMEPVKGGSLANLPPEAQGILDGLGRNYSAAAYALRFAAGYEDIIMVLSGMASEDMVRENTSLFSPYVPLDEEEQEAIRQVRGVFRKQGLIPCTSCRYCVSECPQQIAIPDLFACFNGKTVWNTWSSSYYYKVHTHTGGKASDCIECGACEDICPQHLPIRKLLKDVAKEFDVKKEK